MTKYNDQIEEEIEDPIYITSQISVNTGIN